MEASPDADLITRELERGSIDFLICHVKSQDEFVGGLANFDPDILLLDNKNLGFDVANALLSIKEHFPETGVLIISDRLGEEKAVELMRNGASDLLFKDQVAERFLSTFQRIIDQVVKKSARVRDEELLKLTCRMAGIGGWMLDLKSTSMNWSPQVEKIHEVPPGYIPSLKKAMGFYPPGVRPVIERAFHQAISEGKPFELDVPFITAKGRRIFVRIIGHRDSTGGRPARLVGSLHDISEIKKTAEALSTAHQFAQNQGRVVNHALDAVFMESQPDRIAEQLLSGVLRQFGAHSVTIWLRNETAGVLEFEYGLENGKFLTSENDTRYGKSLPLRFGRFYRQQGTFSSEKSYMLEDIREGIDFPWRGYLLDQGVIMTLKVPMMVGGEIAGLMGVRFTEKRNLLPGEIDIAQSLANQAMLSLRLSMLTARKREAAVIDERNRMAREIHDTLAQGFTGVIVQMEAAEEAINQKRVEKVPQYLRRAADLARESLKEARRSVKALRPEILEKKNLGETLRDEIEKMTHGTSLRSEFSFHGEQRELPSEWELNLLRIGTEVLTNTLRHAKAEEFHGSLVFDRDEMRLHFWDNGIGFEAVAKSEGYGLKGMIERAESIGALLSLKSTPGEGTRVEIVLPLVGKTGNQSS